MTRDAKRRNKPRKRRNLICDMPAARLLSITRQNTECVPASEATALLWGEILRRLTTEVLPAKRKARGK